MRIHNSGKIFNPISYYENKDNLDMIDELMGVKLINGTAKQIDFRQTFGTNNLMIIF